MPLGADGRRALRRGAAGNRVEKGEQGERESLSGTDATWAYRPAVGAGAMRGDSLSAHSRSHLARLAEGIQTDDTESSGLLSSTWYSSSIPAAGLGPTSHDSGAASRV